jgi:predicted nucleic acid-binding protein
MPAVSNSSPLILYSRINGLSLLQKIFGELLIPPAVWHEVVTVGYGRIGSTEAGQASWIRQSRLPEDTKGSIPSGLDQGEAEAIALAASLSPRIPVILDDRPARLLAKRFNLQVIGSAGVLVLAKRTGHLAEVHGTLALLMRAGLYLDSSVYQEILALAGEL